jgi:hypothetical protein
VPTTAKSCRGARPTTGRCNTTTGRDRQALALGIRTINLPGAARWKSSTISGAGVAGPDNAAMKALKPAGLIRIDAVSISTSSAARTAASRTKSVRERPQRHSPIDECKRRLRAAALKANAPCGQRFGALQTSTARIAKSFGSVALASSRPIQSAISIDSSAHQSRKARSVASFSNAYQRSSALRLPSSALNFA